LHYKDKINDGIWNILAPPLSMLPERFNPTNLLPFGVPNNTNVKLV